MIRRIAPGGAPTKGLTVEDVAFNGRILNVNLTTGEIEPEEIPERMYRELLGGMGLGARLLFDRIPADADPLGPDNILGFFPGLLTGTPLFGQRFQVVAKSPKNGGWGDANCGGDFGPMLEVRGLRRHPLQWPGREAPSTCTSTTTRWNSETPRTTGAASRSRLKTASRKSWARRSVSR